MAKSDIKDLIRAGSAKMQPKIDLSISEELKRRLDEIELLIEEIGQTRKLADSATDYFNESAKELAHLRWYRIITMACAGLLVMFLVGFLVCVVFYHQTWFYLQGEVTRSAIIVGALSGSIILMSVAIRGVFKATSDRSKEDGLPDHLKDAIEIVKQNLAPFKGR
jgi:hypothetical protein